MPRKKHPRLPIVYQVTNKVSGKIYIGVTTKPLAERWYGHLLDARTGKTTVLHKAIRKYGEDNFEIVQIASVLVDAGKLGLQQAEMLAIEERNAQVPSGYNMTPGGNGVGSSLSRLGTKATEEHKAKLRAAWTPERKAKFVERMTRPDALANRKAAWTDEQRKLNGIRRGEVNKRIAADPVVRAKMSSAWTDERKADAAERMREIRKSPEAIANHRAATAASWTPERRARQSEIIRASYQRRMAGE